MPPMTDNNKLPLRISKEHGAEEMTLASLVQVVAIAAILVLAVFAAALAAKAVF